MKDKLPNSDIIHPVKDIDYVTYVKPTITNKNIIVGDFTYISDIDFESHVTHHYDFYGDKLIIGKYCQIAAGVNFIMNGANHQMNCVSTFPFYIFEGWTQKVPPLTKFPLKGETIIGNDVWIGQDATIMPGVKIGNGAIIGTNSMVASDIPAYTIAAGNPAKIIRNRFDDQLIKLLDEFKWWDKSVEEVNELIPLLTNNNIEEVKTELLKLLGNKL